MPNQPAGSDATVRLPRGSDTALRAPSDTARPYVPTPVAQESRAPTDTALRAPTGERAERSRRAILAAAREAFLREGYGVGMDSLAERAGVSKVTIYNHFHSKETLFTAVVGDALDESMAHVLDDTTASLAISADLAAVARALKETMLAWVRGSTDPLFLGLRNLLSGEMRRFPQLVPAWHERGPARYFLALHRLLSALGERGLLRIPDTRIAILQLFGLTLYPHLVFSSEGSTIDDETAATLVDSGVEMFVRFYAP